MSLRQRVRTLGSAWLWRKSYQELRGMRQALEAQTAVLEKLLERVMPEPADAIRTNAVDDGTGPGLVDHLDSAEMALALAFEQRMQQQNGTPPTDDQILAYLAEEQTQAQHSVLNEQFRDDGARRRRS